MNAFPAARPVTAALSALLVCLLLLPGCTALQQFANLRQVDFSLDSVTQARLAGVELDRVRSYRDLSALDVARLGTALARQELPLEFTLNVGAENPDGNGVDARLLKMDWTLFLEDRETISGVFNDDILLPAGQTVGIPITMRLDLVDFFDKNIEDLVELALAVSGQGGAPKEVKLQAQPTIDTPVGALRYPRPITIVAREVGR